jgi:hypothetical protein
MATNCSATTTLAASIIFYRETVKSKANHKNPSEVLTVPELNLNDYVPIYELIAQDDQQVKRLLNNPQLNKLFMALIILLQC